MLKALLSSCLLLSLLSPALPLKCRFVYDNTGLTYNSYAITTCDFKEDSCVASALRTNIVKLQEQLLNKCSSSSGCFSGHYSFTAVGGKFFEMKKYCCNTGLCNNATLSLPDRNMLAENGLQCPSCFSLGTKKCKSETTINCLENETQCVDFKGDLSIGLAKHYNFTFQGCGTTDFCTFQNDGLNILGTGGIVIFVFQERCYNASRISHQLEHEG